MYKYKEEKARTQQLTVIHKALHTGGGGEEIAGNQFRSQQARTELQGDDNIQIS